MLALVIGLISGTQQAEADSTYTITIPSTLDVHDSGWNELPGGIQASGSLDSGKKLVVTVSSDNGLKFVHSVDKTQTVSYDFCASSDDLTPITTWEFDSLSADIATTKTAGINVEDLTDKLGGTYTETVTFTVKVENVPKTYVTLKTGDILHVGDSVFTDASDQYAIANAGTYWPAGRPYTLVRANITPGEMPWDDSIVEESDDGAYYTFRENADKYPYCSSGMTNPGEFDMLGLLVFNATSTSDGLSVEVLPPSGGPSSGLAFTVHEP